MTSYRGSTPSISEIWCRSQRVLSLQRDEARIQEGEVGTLIAQIAKTRAARSCKRRDCKLPPSIRTGSLTRKKSCAEGEGRIAELQERKIAAEDQLRRVELRAPIDGIIHELSVHTVGGVVEPRRSS